MSKRNTDFFEEKKDWSRIKDTLLGAYLPVYFQKVIHTKKPIVYVDCFAGAGKFARGDEDGSPLIALKERRAAIAKSTYSNPKIDMYFIEPVYADALQKNIADFASDDGHGRINVVRDTYENAVPRILSGIKDANVFLYVDPFGIKYLGNRIFVDVCKDFKGSVELLLNLNSFGFIREACRVSGTTYSGENIDLEEREESVVDKSIESERLMTAIAGGEYWKKIIEDYRNDSAVSPKPSLTAEKAFSAAYRRSLSRSRGGCFRYVLDMPIRVKAGSYPKYRMVHATNHPDGCIAMADNMFNRAGDLYVDVQSGGQLSLFEFDVNQNMKAEEDQIRSGIVEVLGKRSASFSKAIREFGFSDGDERTAKAFKIRLNSLLADFFCENGVVCAKKDVIEILKKLEREGIIEVSREPSHTDRGAETKFWSDDKGKTVFIKRKV